MTPFPHPGYASGEGEGSISAGDRDAYDFNRLERAVSALADALGAQGEENADLRSQFDQNAQRIRTLEGQLLEANQRRQDVAKRVEELITQLDHLDGELEGAEV